ncbi:MAG: hypothetical protein D6761_09160 [Candidatus Dadabacteria bacterium]|nr:MAG: hypothetical protein D6761_09160 [Candidatus Dadabacteria bacterium]
MTKRPRYLILETDRADAIVSVASRLLAWTALEADTHLLVRLAATRWLLDPLPADPPSAAVLDWLARQEFDSVAAYWRMALAATQTTLYVCSSSQPDTPVWAFETVEQCSLTRFLLDAEAEGAHTDWVV